MDTKANLTAVSSVSLSAAVAAVLGESKVKAELVGSKLYVMAALDVDTDMTGVKSKAGLEWLKEMAIPHVDVGNGMEAHCLRIALVHTKGSDGTYFVQTEDAHTKAVKAAYKKLFKGKELPSIEAMEQILSLIGVKVEE